MSTRPQPDTSDARSPVDRPGISVIVPFAGSRADGLDLIEALGGLRLREGDEIIVADNSPDQILAAVATPPRCRIVPALGSGSPARGRNAGALAAGRDWLLFIDSDCRPEPDLLDDYFAMSIPDDCGIVAGRVVESDSAQASVAAEYAATRGVLEQESALAGAFRPWVMTANVLVRTEVWRQLGGFLEGIFNGEDVDFCWRAQGAGWTIELNTRATVVHIHRDTVRGLLKQAAVRRASAYWIHRRWPQAALPALHAATTLARSAGAIPVFLALRQPRRAALKALDGAVVISMLGAAFKDNRALEWPALPAHRRPIQVWCDEFPELSQTFVLNEARQLAELGHPVRIVAWRRPDRPALHAADLRARWLEDDTPLERVVALARLAARHPIRCLRDVVDRRALRSEEAVPPLRVLASAARRADEAGDVVLHAHFAGVIAQSAMRVGRIIGRPWSLTAHAYDIYQSPANLRTKLASAALVTSGCDYTVRDLRQLTGDNGRVVRIIMGVDPGRFRRRTAHPAGGTVVAVGRLVEKKGFIHLVRAAADPALRDRLGRIVIAGEGPEREILESEARALGVERLVELPGRMEAEDVRELLEDADVLAMPSVVAADGDRDSMPVVVKEALAMEVPVVVSDEVGLPELVRPEFGRCVAPGDSAALAGALAELLALPAERRAEMGRKGREFVSEHANVKVETAKLSELLGRLGASAA